MKLTFLGTSAGENYPALWCHCPNCEYARKHGGRNIRQNSCAFIDDDTMIDLSNHAFQTALQLGIDITAMKVLLMTHDHKDHFYTHHLIWRGMPVTADLQPAKMGDAFRMDEAIHWMGARMTAVPHLDIYGHETIYQTLLENDRYHPEHEEEMYNLTFHALQPAETIHRPDLGLTFTAVLSNHKKDRSTYNYIIEREGKTLLYALDCGGYEDDMWKVIAQHQYDCVVLEGTFGLMPDEFPMHQNLNKNLRYLDFLNANHLWKKEQNFILSHMAPHWTPPYDEYVKIVEPYGIQVAYDGLTIEF